MYIHTCIISIYICIYTYVSVFVSYLYVCIYIYIYEQISAIYRLTAEHVGVFGLHCGVLIGFNPIYEEISLGDEFRDGLHNVGKTIIDGFLTLDG